MISNNKKRIEITLSNEDWELLNSLCFRFNITKSEAIKQCLKVFAASRKHIFTISYRAKQEDEPIKKPKEEIRQNVTSTNNNKEWNKILDELDTSR